MDYRTPVIAVSFLALAACHGSDSAGGGGGTTTVTLSGQAQVEGSAPAVFVPASVNSAARPARLVPPANVALVDADVTLFKIFPDGVEEQVDIGTVITDEAGAYSIPDVSVPTTGTGSAEDFYYEVRVSDGGDIDVRAPAAPAADATVNVNPETNLAAKILSDVAEVPGTTDLPTPSGAAIEAMRELVDEDASMLRGDGAINVPDATASGAADVLTSANGIASAGGDAEKLYKAVQFEAEALDVANAITAGTASAEDAGAYIKRVTREGCNQIASGNPMPAAAALALGEAALAETTFTPQEVVDAYNANNGVDPNADVVLADKVTQFAELLTGVEDKFDASVGAPEDLDDNSQVVLYTQRDLSGADFAADTPLAPDQAAAFLQSLPLDDTNPGSDVCSFGNNVDVTGIVAELTGAADLAQPAIADVQIYHDMGFGCTAGDPPTLGHFRAEVDVYAPGVAVESVTVDSTEATALGGDGTEALSPQGNRWMSNTDGVCVNLGQDVTYTITATLSAGDPVTTTVTRNHPLVPEASTTVNGSPTSNDANNPDVFIVSRPVYTWESPEDMLASIPDAPAGSAVKYTYEFSHVAITGSPSGPLAGCNAVNSGGSLAMYSVDSFIPTVDCDIAACAVSSGEAESNIVCRLNIQTFLVDEYDRLLGQAAGHFPVYCVDTNGDGDCGE